MIRVEGGWKLCKVVRDGRIRWVLKVYGSRFIVVG